VASKPVHLNAVIRDTEELLKRIITEDIHLRTELSREKIVVLADVIHINQILFNLASNAKDAMPTGGELKISTNIVELDEGFIRRNGFGKIGEYGLLSVSDTGTGMDETTMQKIFDPFFTTKEVGKGTGLGLSSVYGIVKQHRGYVAIESEINKGSLFHIYLPILREHGGMHQDLDAAPAPAKGEETILIAEDDNAARFFIKELLTDCGYQVIDAVDGEDALEKFHVHEDIALVILDSVMPKLNGSALNEIIQKTRPGTRTLFMSGYTKDIVLSKGILDQSVDFIAKPVHPDKLLERVREILDRQQE
jgi:CheY-like chemotaxis protein